MHGSAAVSHTLCGLQNVTESQITKEIKKVQYQISMDFNGCQLVYATHCFYMQSTGLKDYWALNPY